MSAISTFKSIENKHNVYGGKDCMKKFCEFLREHTIGRFNFKKNNVIKKQTAKIKNEMQKSVIFVKKSLKINMLRIKSIVTGKYRSSVRSICNSKTSATKEIPIVLYSESNYSHHFIIKKVAEEFEGYFTCLGENTENRIDSKIEKEVIRSDKNEKEITKTISHRLQFINSARFIASSWLNRGYSLAEEPHKIKCKCEHNDKKCETCGIKHKDCAWFLEDPNFIGDLIEYKCCSKNYQKRFYENLKKRFFNTDKFSNHDINKCVFLLWRSVCPYENM